MRNQTTDASGVCHCVSNRVILAWDLATALENPVLGGVFLCLAELRNSATQVPSSFLQVLSGIVLVPRSQQVFQRLPHQITSNWIWCACYYVFNDFNCFNSAFRVVRWRVDLIAHGSLNGTAGPVLVGNSGMMSST